MSSSLLPLMLCLIILGSALGRPQDAKDGSEDGKNIQYNAPNFPGIPKELEQILPPDVVAQLKAIHSDASLSFPQKQEKIDKVMTALPTEILDRIPSPPGFDRLPAEVVAKLKAINRNGAKTWAQKQQELHGFISSLPFDQKAIIMGMPPSQQ